MTDQNQGRARDFFGPLWAWLMIGVGLLLVTSTYVLHEVGVAEPLAFVPFGVGVVIFLAIMAYLAIEGRKSWPAYFWFFHLDDSDLLMGRKKND
jgi:hypothetical protein